MLILATQVNICTNMIIQHLNKMKKIPTQFETTLYFKLLRQTSFFEKYFLFLLFQIHHQKHYIRISYTRNSISLT